MVARVGADCLSTPPEVVRLPGYRLAFNMRASKGGVYANLLTPGDGVLGVVYWCSPAMLQRLDAFEQGYDRAWVEVIDRQGATRPAVVYFAKPALSLAPGRPSEQYLAKILTGARDQGLPDDYVRGIAALACEVHCGEAT